MILTVAGFFPVFIVLGAFVIDIGDGMEHRRQLQLQADAGALAAGQEFRGCRTDPVAANAAIKAVAEEYATEKNVLFPGTDADDRLSFEVNDDPCADRFVHVTLTEGDSPDFFSHDTDDYSAEARVKIFQLQSVNGLLPLAVPVPDPEDVEAVFVDETNGQELERVGLDPGTNAHGLEIWETTGPAEVDIPSEHVGVQICIEDAVSACYDPSGDGLYHIRGWTDGSGGQNSDGLTQPPVLESVSLEPASPECEDARFNPSFSPATPDCDSSKRNVTISAVVDFGGDPANVLGSVKAEVNGTETDLTLGTASPWAATGTVAIPAGEGPITDIDILWEAQKGQLGSGRNAKKCSDKNGNPCKDEFPDVQRHYRTSEDGSGPIELIEVSEPNVTDHANSLEEGLHDLNVKIGIAGTLESAGPHVLSIAEGSGSQTQTLDCNANKHGDVEIEVIDGCQPRYRVNTEGIDCPDDVTSLLTPWPCVQVTPGDRKSQMSAALNMRILGVEKPNASDCPEEAGDRGYNQWPSYALDDPRLVYVFQTSLGAFGTGGNPHSVPITGLRAFYITAWQGNPGFENPCNGDDGDDLEPATVLGHYVPELVFPNDGGAGPNPCNFQGFQLCTPVLID